MNNLLDIVMAAPANALKLEDCLSALEREMDRSDQSAAITLNVAHAGSIRTSSAQRFPHARWIECGAHATLPELWGRALMETRGEWVAMLDADCAVTEQWLSTALGLIAQHMELAGGAVEPRGLHSNVAWAAYFCDYGAFMPPLAAGTAHAVTGNNLIVRRALFARAHLRELVTPQFWKAHFVHALSRQGIIAQNVPALVVYYEKNYRPWDWLVRRYEHARCFAAMRVAHAPMGLRAALAVFAPSLPLVLFVRLARSVLPKRRYRREFFRALAWILAGLSAWALGEWMGYWFGEGDSCTQIF